MPSNLRPNQNRESRASEDKTLEQLKRVDNYLHNENFLDVFKQRLVELQQDISDFTSGIK